MVARIVWNLDPRADCVAACDAGITRIKRRIVDSPALDTVVEATACPVSACIRVEK